MSKRGDSVVLLDWKMGLTIGVGGSSAIAASTVFFSLAQQSPACACKPDIYGNSIRPILLAQQAFHIETGQLADQSTLESWWATSFIALSGNHRYRIEKEPGPETESVQSIAYAYAIPQDPNFYPQVGPFKGAPKPTYYSVIGAIAYDEITSDYRQIQCASPDASDKPVEKPRFVSGRFYCSEDSVELD